MDFLNINYTDGKFNKVEFIDVQKLAGSCGTGCDITDTGTIEVFNPNDGFKSTLVTFSETANYLQQTI